MAKVLVLYFGLSTFEAAEKSKDGVEGETLQARSSAKGGLCPGQLHQDSGEEGRQRSVSRSGTPLLPGLSYSIPF